MEQAKTEVSPSYDKLWGTVWGDLQRYGPVHRHSKEGLVRLVSALDAKSVLDVGCGSGENIAALAALGRYELTGVDISEVALKSARFRVPSAHFSLLDIEHQTLSEKFDLVVSIQVVEHLVDDISAFRNLAAMARRYVFISTMQGRMRASEISIGHVRNYSALELRSKLEREGLKVIKMWGWGFPFYSPLFRSAVEWFPGGPPTGRISPARKVAANLLYHLYRFNWPGRGDILNVLAGRLT